MRRQETHEDRVEPDTGSNRPKQLIEILETNPSEAEIRKQAKMSASYPIGTRSECERLVRDWGFSSVFTWADGGNAHYPPHTHGEVTTHLIRRGQFTVTYPDDNSTTGKVKKETFGAGARIDVPAGKLHEVWIGPEGCEYVIGE